MVLNVKNLIEYFRHFVGKLFDVLEGCFVLCYSTDLKGSIMVITVFKMNSWCRKVPVWSEINKLSSYCIC